MCTKIIIEKFKRNVLLKRKFTKNIKAVHEFNIHFIMDIEQQCAHTNLQKHYQQNVHAT